MATTVLSDDVINPTELRNNQKRWLDKAYVSPVSIMSGRKRLVILNRDYAKYMYLLTQYAESVVQFCREQATNGRESRIFPWIKHLDSEEIGEFRKELLLAFQEAVSNRDWVVFEELIDDWKATANVASNPKLMKALLAGEDSSTYVKLKNKV